jgi:hypothetical protein
LYRVFYPLDNFSGKFCLDVFRDHFPRYALRSLFASCSIESGFLFGSWFAPFGFLCVLASGFGLILARSSNGFRLGYTQKRARIRDGCKVSLENLPALFPTLPTSDDARGVFERYVKIFRDDSSALF